MTQSEQKHYPFGEGMPTGPDVDALLKAWPQLEIGARLAYSDVARVIGVENGTARWKTVTDAWRRRLLEQGLVLECEPGSAFYVASAEQITGGSHQVLRHISRSAKKQRRKLGAARPVDENQARLVEHHGRLFQMVEKHAGQQRRNLLPSTIPPEHPRIRAAEVRARPPFPGRGRSRPKGGSDG